MIFDYFTKQVNNIHVYEYKKYLIVLITNLMMRMKIGCGRRESNGRIYIQRDLL